MKIVILEADSLGEDIKLDHFFKIGEVAIYGNTTPEQAPERIAEADAVIVNKLPMNESTLKDAQFVKYIGLTATGTNNIDFAYTNERGITVTNVAGYSTGAVAQHTFAMVFYLLEHLRYYDDYVKSGAYTKCETFCHMDRKFNELEGKTWGIIGLGAIGTRVANLASAFGCEVIYYSASGKKRSEVYRQVDLDTLLAESDIVSCHAPLKKEKIAAAGLDVLETEPMDKDNPLRKLDDSDRLLITPHIAWAAVEARNRLLEEAYKNLKAFQKGEERNVCRG